MENFFRSRFDAQKLCPTTHDVDRTALARCCFMFLTALTHHAPTLTLEDSLGGV